MYKNVLFDWDGCLAKTLHVWLNAYKTVFKDEKIEINEEEIVKNAFGQREKGLEYLGSKYPDASWKKVVNYVNRNVKNVDLYDGARELLMTLHEKGRKMALLTQSDRETVMPAIKNSKIQRFFEVILTKDDIVNKKPDPEIALKAMQKMSAERNETIIVGDSYHDIRCGKNARIKTVAFYPEENHKFYTEKELKKENPDYLIYNLNEIVEIVG